MTFQCYKNPSNSPLDLAAWVNFQSGPVCDHIILEPTSTDSVEFPHKTVPCTLIASNQSPGFGPACTQEELVTGACPPLLLLGALLISPPVATNACLLAYGIFPLTYWKGQGRKAYSLGASTVSQHTFLLLDASELDMVSAGTSVIADLHPQYLVRDLNKAYTGFLALRHLDITEISSPLWGAGAFSGDPIVKSLILAIAATRAGITVHLTVDKERTYGNEFSSGASTTILAALEQLQQCLSMNIPDIMQEFTSPEIVHCRTGLDVVRQFTNIGPGGGA